MFAIRPIPKATRLFGNDRVPMVWVDRSAIDRGDLSPAERRLYHDFGVARRDAVGCPVSFDSLTPGWYLNEPAAGAQANVASNAQLEFFALRDIAEGEELTIRYAGFSDSSGR